MTTACESNRAPSGVVCISHSSDFQPCQDSCNVGNIGAITSCANSKRNTVDACAV